MTITTTPATTKTQTAAHVTLQAFRWTGLALAWAVQYTCYVPAVLLCRLAGRALKLGVVGVLLLCLPVVGWVILALWLMLRHPAPAYNGPGAAQRMAPLGRLILTRCITPAKVKP